MNPILQRPVELLPASAWRTYSGGKLIAELHGEKNSTDTNFPEEWILSTVRARNSGREHIVEGLTMLKDCEMSLADLFMQDPVSALGKEHAEKYGAKAGVLVKLLDSAERLTVQVHPTRKKAKELFDSEFGKTECWHILGTREINGEKPCIYFGFKKGVTREMWKDIFDKQDIRAMLHCLHKFEVKPGDTFLIDGGIPHAIGPGCFLIEVQEPTDLTIRTERTTPKGIPVADTMCHQGIGFEKMFDIFEYGGMSEQETLDKYYINQENENVISYSNTEMFRLALSDINGKQTFKPDGSFCGIYVLSGEGTLDGRDVKPGSQFFISSVCDEFEIHGNMRYIRFYGPKI